MAFKSSISRARFLLIVMTMIFCFLPWLQCANCFEFEVNERSGWVVPPANHTEMYNEWASRKRFKVGDTIRFNYKKDSVMEVTKKDYKVCNSMRPDFFSNTGNTVVTLNRTGFFYFISGAAGHCEKGQKLIVWVMAQDTSGGTAIASSSNALLSYGLIVVIVVFQFVYHN